MLLLFFYTLLYHKLVLHLLCEKLLKLHQVPWSVCVLTLWYEKSCFVSHMWRLCNLEQGTQICVTEAYAQEMQLYVYAHIHVYVTQFLHQPLHIYKIYTLKH
jgi:hypothetical protein